MEAKLDDWFRACYFENRQSLLRRVSDPDKTDWSMPGIQVGALCLNPLFEAIVCFAAGDRDLVNRLLDVGRARVTHVISEFGNKCELDEVGLDRVQAVLALRWLATTGRYKPDSDVRVPFEAFSRFLDSLQDLDLKNAVRIYWAVFAIFEGSQSEYEKAMAVSMKVHRDLRDEMELLKELPSLTRAEGLNSWERFRSVMGKWVDPRNDTEGYATNYQLDFSLLFVLFWVKFRLQSSGLESLLSVHTRGETWGYTKNRGQTW